MSKQMSKVMRDRDRKAKLKRKRTAKREERAMAKEVLAENMRYQARYVTEMIEGDDPRGDVA
jgi:hypothetical protein